MLVYHFTKSEHALANIRNRQLKIAEIFELNDPLELLSVALRSEDERELLQSWKRDFAQKFGMICFSRDWQNPVQWSHYADRHKGICLGFDVPKVLLQRVTYESYRPKANLALLNSQGRLTEAWMRSLLARKFRHWSYEKEERRWVPTAQLHRQDGLLFQPFDDQMKLRKVIVGEFSKVSRSDLSSALGDLGDRVEVEKARLAFQSFRVTKQLREEKWK